jgi:hypothetical protein
MLKAQLSGHPATSTISGPVIVLRMFYFMGAKLTQQNSR